jgi:hypothetical protein
MDVVLREGLLGLGGRRRIRGRVRKKKKKKKKKPWKETDPSQTRGRYFHATWRKRSGVFLPFTCSFSAKKSGQNSSQKLAKSRKVYLVRGLV